MTVTLSIRLRLTLVYGLLLLLTLGGFDLLLYWTLLGNLSREFDDQLRFRAAAVTRELHAGPGGRLEPGDIEPGSLEPASLENAAEPGVYVQVINVSGAVIGNSGTLLPVDLTLLGPALAGDQIVGNIPIGSDDSIRAFLGPVYFGNQVIGVVQVSQSTQFFDATLAQVRDLLLLGSLAALALATAGGWLMLGRALRPVVRVTEVARRIMLTGRLQERLPDPGPPDEAGQLARAFNLMVDRLEAAFEQQRQLLADTSHELRNPLTALSGNLDILQLDLDPDERQEVVLESKQQAAHMSRLVADLLLLARADAGQPLERQRVCLSDLIQRVHQRAEATAGDRTVRLERRDAATVLGDADRLQQLCWNLVENAVRYTGDEGLIVLSLQRRGDQVEFSVRDDGPGIAAEHLDRIFERFYRVDRARSRRTGGTGLGLAIARYLAQAHGGTISVSSAVNRGSTFVVRLPCLAATTDLPSTPTREPSTAAVT